MSQQDLDFHLESLLKQIPGVVYQFVVSPEGEWRFAYISDTVRDLYEVTPESVLLDHNALTSKIHPDDQLNHRKSVEDAVKNCTAWAHLHRITTPSGRNKWVLAQATPELAQDGSVVWCGVLTDLTTFLEGENLFFRLLGQYRKSLSEREFLLEQDTQALERIEKSYISKVGTNRISSASSEVHSALNNLPAVKETGISRPSDVPSRRLVLSSREHEVLELMAQGLSSKEMATRLSVSITTISAHRRNMKKKLGFRSGTDLMRYAMLIHSTEK